MPNQYHYSAASYREEIYRDDCVLKKENSNMPYIFCPNHVNYIF
ncbi:MAG: hypothetical protein PWQ63_891 [Methanolobus sp.]|jgi:hypothetical protein|nr:hypothetical protein [Methanolobus sp.]MDK2947731.1 hypothetical protein [Methanolobus sp.]